MRTRAATNAAAATRAAPAEPSASDVLVASDRAAFQRRQSSRARSTRSTDAAPTLVNETHAMRTRAATAGPTTAAVASTAATTSHAASQEHQRTSKQGRSRRSTDTAPIQAKRSRRAAREPRRATNTSDATTAKSAQDSSTTNQQRKRTRQSTRRELNQRDPQKRSARGGTLQLCEFGERHMLSFLPVLPDRIKAEAVCKRWRNVSLHDIAIEELDFEKISARAAEKKDVVMMLQRARGRLRRLVLPDVSMNDAVIQSVVAQTNLESFHAHRCDVKCLLRESHLDTRACLLCGGLTCGLGCRLGCSASTSSSCSASAGVSRSVSIFFISIAAANAVADGVLGRETLSIHPHACLSVCDCICDCATAV